MSKFLKNCWYWGYVNRKIEESFSHLADEDKLIIRLEDVQESLPRVCEFIGVSSNKAKNIPVENKANYKRFDFANWSVDERYGFEKFCGEIMDKFYPGWRDNSNNY